jgi:tetratricopeptide (TPR) repeat protein
MKSMKLIRHGWIILLFIFLVACTTETKDEAMNATSNSKKAIELYTNAYEIAYGVLELEKAVSVYEKATIEDPNFFMAYYQLATYHLFHKNTNDFIESATAGIGCQIELSKGEEIQKKILEEWLKDMGSDVSELGQQLVDQYPNDPDAYLNLGFIYYLNKDYPKAIEVFDKTMTMEDLDELYCGPKLAIVPICMLGYSYLISDQLDKAKTSFDNYINQFPNDQNPYDCKADYFMTIEDYDKAYESYMKAYNIDTTYQVFLQRAQYAKHLNDSIQNK